MHIARLIPQRFPHAGEKGDDIMMHLRFNGFDAPFIKMSVGANAPRGIVWDELQFGLSFTRQNLNLQPDGKTAGIAPDGGHVLAAVTLNHESVLHH